ncbi:MAG: LptA/OstA family protein [Candidatus Margulisiibacteriota bacterium]
MENNAWKIVYLATIFSLIVLGLAYYLMVPRDAELYSQEKTDKLAEFYDTRVTGRKEGRKLWEFTAEKGWTLKNQDASQLINVKNGRIFNKKGALVVASLVAPRAIVNPRTEIIEAFGQPEGVNKPSKLKAVVDLGKFSSKNKQDWTTIIADYIIYRAQQSNSEMTGRAFLIKKNSRLLADAIGIDHEKKIARISGHLRLQRQDGLLKAFFADYYGESEKLDVYGSVTFEVKDKGSKATTIRCGRAILFNDPNQDVELYGGVEAVQGKKVSLAGNGIYSRKGKKLFLFGETKTIIEKAQALVRQETARKIHDVEFLRARTYITSDSIEFSTRSGNARAAGNVVVTQKGKEAKAESAYYDDKREILTMKGSVQMKKGTDWLSCKKITVYISREVFEAEGMVEAKFEL